MNYLNNGMVVWWYCLVAFFAGALVFYLVSVLYVHMVLRKDSFRNGKEIKHPVRSWHLNPFHPVLVLKAQRDKSLNRAEALERSLKERTRKLEETARMLKVSQNRVDNLDKQNSLLIRQIKNSTPAPNNLQSGTSGLTGKVTDRMGQGIGNSSLFFTIPEADGSFYVEKGEPVQDERKYFRIVPLAGTDRGELHFISGRFDLKAIENIDYYLFPVCEVENTHHRESASRVMQLEPGSVTCTSGKWKVDKKVTVKLV